MIFGAGIVIITLVSLLGAWLIFDFRGDDSKSKKIARWFTSTVILWVLLVIWISYREPDIDLVISAGVSLVFSALVNLVRSQWIFLLP